MDLTTAAQTAPTGSTITFVATVRNTGNDVFGFTAHLSTTPGRLVSVPAGCDRDGTCPVSLGPGETKTFAFSGEVTNDIAAAGQQFRGLFSGFTTIPDDMPIQFSGSKAMPITLSPAQLDLGVAFAVPSATSSIGGQFESALTVTNAGPAAAAPVAVTLSISPDPVRLLAALPLSAWDCVPACDGCTAGIRNSFTCTLGRLGANESSTARLEFEVSLARTYTITAAVSTANATDIAFANNTSTTTAMIGTSSDFTRALVPLLANQTPGAFTTWSSELWAQSTAPGTSIVYCHPDCPADLNQTTHLFRGVVEKLWPVSTIGALPHGAMLYFESRDAPFTSFSSRLYNTRNSPARAVEQPVIREAQFRKDRLIIPTIVLDPSHRFLLRVYDPDATPNAVVRVRLFSQSPDITLAERTLILTTNPTRIPALNVPAFPGYGESSDLFISEIPVSGSRVVGVEIVSVTPGLKLWAFVSATENAGEHVTIVSSQ